MQLLAKLIFAAALLLVSPLVLADVQVRGMGAALWAALVYGLLFVLIGWLVRLVVAVLAIVPGLFTFGLFFLLVPWIANTVLLKLTADMLGGFDIGSWTSAFLLSAALAVLNAALERPAPKPKARED
jgi:putative membrane protein